MTRTAFYPGSFDPVTFGHLDIIARARALCDRLVIGVGAHHEKRGLFPVAERIDMLQTAVRPIAERTGMPITVISFTTLTVEAAAEAGAHVILRGLRDAADFAYEMQMAGMNARLCDKARGRDNMWPETAFLPASPEVRHIAAKFVRQIAAMGGEVSAFVPEEVAQRLRARFSARRRGDDKTAK